MWWHMHEFGFGGGLIMFILGILLIALLVWGILSLTRVGRGRMVGSLYNRQEPLEIARERYAKGELTREQFEEIKKGLQ
jgi:putative membrane protein